MFHAITFLFVIAILWFFIGIFAYIAAFAVFELEKNQINLFATQWVSGLLTLVLVMFSYTGLNLKKIQHFLALYKVSFWQTIGFVTVCVAYLLVLKLPAQGSIITHRYSEMQFFLIFLSIVLIAPIMEEAIFRGGMFYNIPASTWQKVGTIFISAITFILIHTHYTHQVILGMLPLAILFGVARVKTGSIIPPILMHSVINLTIFLRVLLQ